VEPIHADACVVGAGPAGSTLAARLAQLGLSVCLVERAPFPRHRLGESLTPGVLPLLEVTGARAAVEAAGFRPVRGVRVHWDRGPERRETGPAGLLVERGAFDGLLLDRARALGVRVLQPATVDGRCPTEAGWALRVRTARGPVEVRAAILADAGGRRAALPARRQRAGCRTVALYAYWHGARLPEEPRIEAGTEAWYWGVPLPDGSYNTLVFLDAEALRDGGRAGLDQPFLALLGRSGLIEDCPDAHRVGPVRACDATPYLDAECVGERTIRIGDAALALDPLSSSGVQQAIRTALAGAVVVNTILRRPSAAAAARAYYRESLRAASVRHRGWAAGLYAAVAGTRGGGFWRARGSEAVLPPEPARAGVRPGPLALSPDLAVADVPCLDGDFVAVTPALCHPALDEPLAFLGGVPLAPLIGRVRPGATLHDLARTWSDRVPLRSGLAIAAWLADRGILVPHRA
jgi:flavin-dependent dehydrogenase